MSLERYWDILCSLQGSDKPLTATRIATRVSHHQNTGVTDKSFKEIIRRDLRNLKRVTGAIETSKVESSIGLEHSDKQEYSWSAKGSEVMAKSLSGAQALALGVLQKIGTGMIPPAILEELEPLFSAVYKQEIYKSRSDEDSHKKITQKAVATAEEKWLKKIKFMSETIGFVAPYVNPDVEKMVHNALYYERLIRVTYDKQEFIVKPLALVQRGVRRYLIGVKLYSDGVPTFFTMSRIQKTEEVHVTDYDEVKGGEDFDLDEFLKKGKSNPVFPAEKLGKPINLKLWVDKGTYGWLKETPIAEGQTAVEVKDGYEVTVDTTLRDELAYWILSMANHVRVIGPKILKERVADDLRKSLSLYE